MTPRLSAEELEKLFDVGYYLRYVDDIFKSLGLTETQCKDILEKPERGQLAPRKL